MDLTIPNTVSLSGAAISDLIRLGDGDTALLYLYFLIGGEGKNAAEMAADLNWSLKRLHAALDKLTSGDEKKETPSVPNDRTPSAVSAKVKSDREKAADKPFYSLVQEVQQVYGRVLSSDELVRLFGIYDDLKLPAEVILQLISYCIAETNKGGGSTVPSIKYIEKAAFTWEKEGILSLDLAEEYIRQRGERRLEKNRVREALQIRDRDFSTTESKYVDNWLALGFTADTIAIAYDRTVTKTGRLAWGYINSIIGSWHEKGLFTVDDIMAKDGRSKSGVKVSGSGKKEQVVPDASELERINRILASMGE